MPRRTVKTKMVGGAAKAAAPTDMRIGFIALTDCAPLIVAKEKGFFERHGLNVTLVREPSWANMRDKVALGALDAAHMLAPMPLAATLGAGGWKKPQITSFVLNLNGNAVTISTKLWNRLVDAEPALAHDRHEAGNVLRRLIAADRNAGRPQLTFATVFNFSSHQIQLRYWLASAGIDPDRDVQLVIVPPPQMTDRLAAGEIDGFCVGDPWNSLAVLRGVGRILISGYEIWNNRVEKVIGTNRDWVERNPLTHKQMLMALIEAAEWLDRPENRLEGVEIMAKPDYIGPEAAEAIRLSMLGVVRYGLDTAPEHMPDFFVFNRYSANFPWRSQAEWYLTEMRRWKLIDPATDIAATADAVYRTDLYREAAAALDKPFPLIDRKPEGLHAGPWTLAQASAPIPMGADLFFDGSYVSSARPVIPVARETSIPAPAQLSPNPSRTKRSLP
ncbi:ABC transporter substrate-binding protein [Ferrovibrio terrae]|uniref:ABC transporter substrate-binding protein n=1 Tax=Ferrovibrio terrae TaxID=2594003 RepID=A0A516H6E0_9PROT|nr:CmpA/NrtA family ABC transporter substrate-binding protein [Ferrovibrio terrae]QDO99322.1 ABC transporter substrate-binding protein [Ferrovibrio terrae]